MSRLSLKSLLIITVFLLIPIVFLLRLNQSRTTASAAWYNDSWLYRQRIDVSNGGTAVTNFQVPLTIGTSALIVSGKMKSDCSDIRVTDTLGSVLPHWVALCNTASTQIYVYDATYSAGNQHFYIYYGNPSSSNIEIKTGTANYPGLSCKTILDHHDASTDGQFYIDPNAGAISDAFLANCDMTTDSGGWTIVTAQTGLTQQGIVSDTETAGSPLSWQAFNINRQKKIDVSNLSTESLIKRSGGLWLKVNHSFFDANLSVGNTHTHWSVTVTAGNGVTAPAIMGYANYNNAGGGDMGITDAGGFDHHSTSYYHLNGGCARHYFYQYGTTYNVNTAIGNWAVSNSCAQNNTALGSWYAGIRGTLAPTVANTTVTTIASEEVSPAPVAYWKFDEGVGSTAFDSSSSRYNLNLTLGTSAPIWQSEDQCISGKCLLFSGNNRTSTLSTPNVPIPTKYTISIWLKGSKASQITENIYILGWNNFISLTLQDSGRNPRTGLLVRNAADNNYYSIWKGTDILDNKWHQLVATVDVGNTVAKIYIDGNLDTNTTLPDQFSGSKQLNIGSWSGTYGNFTGYLDDAKIYPYARTPAQITADYNAGKAHASSSKGSAASLGNNAKNNDAFSNGLIGYWKMDENVGTSTLDSSGNNNTATFGTGSSAPGWTTGKYGVGLSLNGVSTYTSIPDSTILNPSTAMTISTWIKTPSPTQNFGMFVTKTDAQSWQLRFNGTTGTAQFVINVGSTFIDQAKYTTTTVLQANTWYMITGVYDGSKVMTYVNGSLDGSYAISGSILTNSNPITFGRRTDGYFYNGLLDETRYYNRALSPTEISQLYNFAPGPIGYWKFDEGTGTTAFDTSGYGNNGGWAGTLGSQWTTGKYNSAGKFDGSTNYLNVGNVGAYANNFSLSGWIYNTSASASEISVFEKRNGTTAGWALGINANGNSQHAIWRTFNAGGQFSIFNGTGINIVPNTWYYLSIIQSDGLASIYINGLQDKSAGITNPATDTTAFRIGDLNGGAIKFTGKIDDVKLYNYAISQKQIIEDMNAGHPSGGSPVGSQVAYYKFDEGYGTVTQNSGNGGIGISGVFGPGTSAPTWTNDGKFGKSLSFDGNDYVTTTLNAPTTGSVTLSAWAKPTDIATSRKAVMGSSSGGRHDIYIDAATPKCRTWDTSEILVTSAKTVANGEWVYLACTLNFDTGGVYLYVNGVLQASSTRTPVGAGGVMQFGKSGATGSNPFIGLIDEVKIYNSALTADEIKIDYNKGSAIAANSFASASTGNTAPASANSQLYCVPGDSSTCAAPLAEYNFDEGTGTTAYDKSGHNNDASFGLGGTAPSWTSLGKNNGAVSFNGTSNFLTTVSVQSSSSVTIEAWINPTTITGSHLIYDQNWGRLLFSQSGAALQLQTDNIGNTITNNNTSAVLTANNWQHVAAVIDTAAFTQTIYRNGVNVGTTTFIGTLNHGSISTIGAVYRGQGSNFFSGKIDNFAIYSYARSPAQIALDYNRGGPIGWWKLDECQGSIAYNSSGIGNSGLITIGAGGSQTSIGTCGVGGTTAWGVGASGKINGSLNFDGTDDYVDAGTAPMFNFINNPFSLSAWIKPTNTVAYHNIMGKGGFWANDEYQMYIKDGNLFNYVAIGGTRYNTPAYPVSNGIWYHVTGVYNGSYIVMYINGTFFGQTAVNNLNLNNTTAFRIGSGNSDRFTGQIDDVRVYNYALTSEQIKLLYNNNGAVRFAPGTGSP